MGWLNCGVTTQATWPKEQQEVKYGDNIFVLMPLTQDNSASVHIQLKGFDSVEGMTLINRFLSALGWKDNQPAINHYGWSGNPIPVAVQKYKIPFGYSPSEYFPNEITEITDKKAKLALALFREGRSLNSVPFQFLSFFKILNIFWRDKYVDEEHELKVGLKNSLPYLTDRDSVKRIHEIKEEYGDPANYLYKSGRCAVAHAFADPIVDPDDLSDLHRLSKDLKLMEKLTAYLIEKKFDIKQSIWE